MAGLDSDFLNVIQPINVVTAYNTVSDSELGTFETTQDRFFLASLEQEYIVPQIAGEGLYWPYWKERLELESPQPQGSGGANANHIRYRYNAHTTAVACRLRSAYRGYAYYTWYVGSSTGVAYYTSSTSSIRGCPACVIR